MWGGCVWMRHRWLRYYKVQKGAKMQEQEYSGKNCPGQMPVMTAALAFFVPPDYLSIG